MLLDNMCNIDSNCIFNNSYKNNIDMTQYIDKAALVAEIERRRQELRPTNTHQMKVDEKMDRDVLMWLNALDWVKKLLDTLEAKEIGVDLGDPKGDIGVKTVWYSSNSLEISRNGNSRNGDDLEEAAIKYGNCFEKHSDLASMAFIKGAMCGKEQAEIQIKAQSMALPHGCLNKEPVSEDEIEKQFKVGDVVVYVSRQPAYSGFYILGNANDLSIGYSNCNEPFQIALRNCTIASEAEYSQFFRELNLNGYKWNNDTLRIEKIEPVSESLEKAATKYAQDKYMPVQTSQAFKAGAEWQKEQMMKDAVYGLVCGHDESSPAWIDLNLLNKPNVKVGTEVKLIIIKDK